MDPIKSYFTKRYLIIEVEAKIKLLTQLVNKSCALCQTDPQGRIQNGATSRAELLIHVQNSLIWLPRPHFV